MKYLFFNIKNPRWAIELQYKYGRLWCLKFDFPPKGELPADKLKRLLDCIKTTPEASAKALFELGFELQPEKPKDEAKELSEDRVRLWYQVYKREFNVNYTMAKPELIMITRPEVEVTEELLMEFFKSEQWYTKPKLVPQYVKCINELKKDIEISKQIATQPKTTKLSYSIGDKLPQNVIRENTDPTLIKNFYPDGNIKGD